MDTEVEFDKKFSEIDILMGNNYIDIDQINGQILYIYDSILKIINDYEYNVNYDENLHKNLKFKYYSHRAIYFESIGESENAQRERSTSNRYRIKDSTSEVKTMPEPSEVEGNLILAKIIEIDEEKSIKEALDILKKNEETLSLIEKLEAEFQILNRIPNTMSNFLAFQKIQGKKIFQDIKAAFIKSDSFENSPNHTNKENEWTESIQKLKNSYEFREYKRKILFMKNIVRLGYGEQSKTLVYSEIPETIEEIKKRKRFILLEFHPDKSINSLDEDKKTIKDCFIILKKIYTDKDEEYAFGGESVTNESNGDYFWKISEVYNDLINKRKISNNLNRSESNNTVNLTIKELEYYRIHNAAEAYPYYYKAVIEITKQNNTKFIEKESSLRHKMAKSLNSANYYLEAKLSILSLIYKLLKNSQITTGKLLNEAQELYKQISDADISLEQDKNSNRCSELIPFEGCDMSLILDKSFDHSQITQYTKSVETQIRRVTKLCLVKPGKKIIDFANMSNNSHSVASKYYIATILSALKQYFKGNLKTFFELLQLPNKDDNDKKILNIEPFTVNPILLINLLLENNFYPHLISYLLILIGLALISGQIEIPQKNSKDLESVAVTFFLAAESTVLNQKANQLDSPEETTRIPALLWFNDFLPENSSSKTIINADELWLPYVARLNEMQNIAKLNLVLIRYIQKDLEAAKTNLREIRKFVKNNYCFVTPHKIRLERIEDFLSIFDPTFTPQQYSNETKADMNESDVEDHLNSLEEELKKITEKSERVKICKEIAAICVDKAGSKEKENKLDSLICWSHAKLEYSRLYKNLNNKDEDTIINYTKCLIKLNKYNEAKYLLDKHESSLLENSNYWYFLAILNKKNKLHDEARSNLSKSLEIDKDNANADQEFRFMKYLIQTVPLEDKLKKINGLKYDENFYANRINNTENYRILSIDGGGIRGIIPAFWLYEIERRTNRPISHLFNMLSGTSTGAIIAAGLSVPKPGNKFTPCYTAFELLDLYRTSGKNIFNTSILSRFTGYELGTSKYTDTGRRGIFMRYFQENRLDKSLTDLVIPCIPYKCGSVLNKPHLFTTFQAKKRNNNQFQNIKYVDALMATTAAPTYFSHYVIDGRVSIDEGVQANNPSQIAYKTAKDNGINENRIRVYSFGTGNYLSDVPNINSYDGKFKWTRNLKDVTIPSQIGIIDDYMSTTLRDRYTRWQIWMDNEIYFDDCREETLNKMQEIANEYIEELCYSDTNSFNKLLEDLEK